MRTDHGPDADEPRPESADRTNPDSGKVRTGRIRTPDECEPDEPGLHEFTDERGLGVRTEPYMGASLFILAWFRRVLFYFTMALL